MIVLIYDNLSDAEDRSAEGRFQQPGVEPKNTDWTQFWWDVKSTFEDGTPYPGGEGILIAPDSDSGFFTATELSQAYSTLAEAEAAL